MDDERLKAFEAARSAPVLKVADLIAVLKTLPPDAPVFLSVPGVSFFGPFSLGSMAIYQWRNKPYFGITLSKMKS